MIDLLSCDIVIRHGYGFLNPNHTAAFICMLLPLLLGWKKWERLGKILALLLSVALVFTYSRSGLLVFAFELVFLWYMLRTWQCRYLTVGAGIVVSVMMILGCAVAGRMVLDNSIFNRLHIWKAGLQLFLNNPLGVGWGNSGRIVSYFILDGIECRTLISTPLTLLVEGGWIVGALWSLFVIIVLCCMRRSMLQLWCAFCAMTLSSIFSTTIDFGMLFDWSYTHEFWVINFVLSWLSCICYLVLGIVLVIRGLSSLRTIIAIIISILVLLLLPLLNMRKYDSPRIDDEVVYLANNIVYDKIAIYADDSSIYEIKKYLQANESQFAIALYPGIPNNIEMFDEVLLFGDAGEYKESLPNHKVTIVESPEEDK